MGNNHRFENRLLRITLILIFIMSGITYAVPYTFQSGEPVSSSQINANFSNLENRIATIESYFTNTVIYVIGTDCPTGFSEYTSANGRFILANTNGDEATGGSEFMSVAQMPAHSHSLGSAGIWNGSGAPSGGRFPGGTAFSFDFHTTAPTGSGSAYWQPYIQLKACRKN